MSKTNPQTFGLSKLGCHPSTSVTLQIVDFSDRLCVHAMGMRVLESASSFMARKLVSRPSILGYWFAIPWAWCTGSVAVLYHRPMCALWTLNSISKCFGLFVITDISHSKGATAVGGTRKNAGQSQRSNRGAAFIFIFFRAAPSTPRSALYTWTASVLQYSCNLRHECFWRVPHLPEGWSEMQVTGISCYDNCVLSIFLEILLFINSSYAIVVRPISGIISFGWYR